MDKFSRLLSHMERRCQQLNETITVASAVTSYHDGPVDGTNPVVGAYGNKVPANADFYAEGDARIPDILGGDRHKKRKGRKLRRKR